MKINGIEVIRGEYVPQGKIIVSPEFADLMFTAFSEAS
jgi:hypothetical protein